MQDHNQAWHRSDGTPANTRTPLFDFSVQDEMSVDVNFPIDTGIDFNRKFTISYSL